jgi:hypothetical protein
VGGLAAGTALRISSGRRVGRGERPFSLGIEPCNVAVLSDTESSWAVLFSELRTPAELCFNFLLVEFAWNLCLSSSCLLFSFFRSSALGLQLASDH